MILDLVLSDLACLSQLLPNSCNIVYLVLKLWGLVSVNLSVELTGVDGQSFRM